MTVHVVYRAYGKSDVLLYVGYSSRLYARLHEHGKDSPWWALARVITHQSFATEEAARAAEATAIDAEKPLFNIVGTSTRTVELPTIRPHHLKGLNIPKALERGPQRATEQQLIAKRAERAEPPRELSVGSRTSFDRSKHVVAEMAGTTATFFCGVVVDKDECTSKQYSSCHACFYAQRQYLGLTGTAQATA